MNKEIESKINISDADVANFYNLHQAEFNLMMKPPCELAQIVVTPNPNGRVENRQNSKARNNEEAHKKINALRYQAGRLGGGIAELAVYRSFRSSRYHFKWRGYGFCRGIDLCKSDPRSIRRHHQTAARPDHQGAAHKQGPSKQPATYIIFKSIAIEPAGQHPLSDHRVQQMIRQQLHDSRSRLLQSAYNEMLRDRPVSSIIMRKTF